MGPSIRLAAGAVLLAFCAAAAGQQNPIARPAPPSAAALNGRWNGINLERRTACTNSQNEGSRGTYAQFDVVADVVGNLSITQSGITGLNCTYTMRHEAAGRSISVVQGSYTCSDGKQGSISGGAVELHALSVDMRLAIRLTAGESCTVDSILSMARFPG